MGKTLRGKLSRAFAVKQTANPAICPVRNLQFFVNLCSAMNVNLSAGFLFRPTSKKGGILNAPLLASTVQARLVKYLSSLGINEGESVHELHSSKTFRRVQRRSSEAHWLEIYCLGRLLYISSESYEHVRFFRCLGSQYD